jgi:hypothetical protein
MTEKTKEFLDKLANGSNVEAGEAFKDALRMKVGDALDNARKDMAANMFNAANPEPVSYSDSKPEVAEPFATTVNDGQAELDLTQGTDANVESQPDS